ncbi:MAG: DUF202 domain-containing protein [Syntrophales bacterium]|jgi:putative membrane protein|nr:DUF202 domain-containing protein [Syntrophales bacterium]MDD5233917.1 DUF202 domain-containing protein [Syntrophales bacterium]
MTENERVHSKLASRRAYMANERTFLAWVRTAIGIMAFGFVFEEFAFFAGSRQSTPYPGYSQWAGLLLVAFGMLITAFAFVRYRTVARGLEKGAYNPNWFLTTALTFFVLAVGFFIILYLMRSF